MTTLLKGLATRARAEGLVIALVAAGYLWETRSIPALYQMPGVPGPAAFPTLLGTLLGLAGLWRLVRGASAGEGGDADAAPAAAGATGARAWLAAHGRFYGLWAVVLGFLALMPWVGFPVGAAVGLALMFRLLGERRWPVCTALAVGAAAVLHVAFAVGLGVRLPLGVLSLLGK
ncbi:MAG TPA: tripartite tricarboxylate transporter TctB family protein [Anaeromyxobacter sp.]|nr:tripartite tricarboxylate transporter TctB family protein [Anaeromyxobacter sp.]